MKLTLTSLTKKFVENGGHNVPELDLYVISERGFRKFGQSIINNQTEIPTDGGNASYECTVGVGSGFVHGNYVEIKTVQKLIFLAEALVTHKDRLIHHECCSILRNGSCVCGLTKLQQLLSEVMI